LLAELRRQMAGTDERGWPCRAAPRAGPGPRGELAGAYAAAAPIGGSFPPVSRSNMKWISAGTLPHATAENWTPPGRLHAGDWVEPPAAREGRPGLPGMMGKRTSCSQQYLEPSRRSPRGSAVPYPHWRRPPLLQAGKCYDMLGQHEEAVHEHADLERVPSSRAAEKATYDCRWRASPPRRAAVKTMSILIKSPSARSG